MTNCTLSSYMKKETNWSMAGAGYILYFFDGIMNNDSIFWEILRERRDLQKVASGKVILLLYSTALIIMVGWEAWERKSYGVTTDLTSRLMAFAALFRCRVCLLPEILLKPPRAWWRTIPCFYLYLAFFSVCHVALMTAL
jgi:hypothetical protein